MSNQEISSQSSPLYSYTFGAMGAGVGQGINIPNYFPSCSSVVGTLLQTAGGAVGSKVYVLPALATAGDTGGTANIYSNSATDTSIYSFTWRNLTAFSKYVSIQPC